MKWQVFVCRSGMGVTFRHCLRPLVTIQLVAFSNPLRFKTNVLTISKSRN